MGEKGGWLLMRGRQEGAASRHWVRGIANQLLGMAMGTGMVMGPVGQEDGGIGYRRVISSPWWEIFCLDLIPGVQDGLRFLCQGLRELAKGKIVYWVWI